MILDSSTCITGSVLVSIVPTTGSPFKSSHWWLNTVLLTGPRMVNRGLMAHRLVSVGLFSTSVRDWWPRRSSLKLLLSSHPTRMKWCPSSEQPEPLTLVLGFNTLTPTPQWGYIQRSTWLLCCAILTPSVLLRQCHVCHNGDLGKHLIRSFVHVSNPSRSPAVSSGNSMYPTKNKAKYIIYAVQPDGEMARIAYKDFGSTVIGVAGHDRQATDVKLLVKQWWKRD